MQYESYKVKYNSSNFEPSDDDLEQIEKEMEILFDEVKNEN